MKAKPGYYFCEVWQMDFHFFLGWPWAEFRKHVLTKFHREIEDSYPCGKAVQIDDPKQRAAMLIWTRKKNDYSTLAHEALHVTNWTLRRAGVQADFYNDEPQAYLMANVIRKALRK